ncbi:S8 family peptidase [Bradyrhizobium sp. SZCCHNPS2010]|uniref:S8 family peptidase n=1 Tax=Bradyrhizobium sp. SZCCHNPS2010 TaxID=3057333 RepID=UPI0029164639|nr:S8 family peptidase [Bradyrhizobium sp. SZCCHNPS2010]
MPIDRTKPLLKLEQVRERRRTAPGRRPRFPAEFDIQRQQRIIGPKFDRLRRAFAAGREAVVELQNDATALAPETMIVFELRSSLVIFAEAVRAIPGLELVADDDGEIGDHEGGLQPGHFYAVFTDERALEQLLSLWRRWSAGEQLHGEFSPWEKVFACLSDLRRWGPLDRVSAVHAEVISRLADDLLQGETLHLEIELVFLRADHAADAIRQRIRAELRDLGAVELSAVRYQGFAFDALLVRVSADAARSVGLRLQDSVAGLRDVFRVRPQSIGRGTAGDDRDAAPVRDDPAPVGEPIVAIFDGVPVANHPYLAGRVMVDDPDGLVPRSVGSRSHGTAMASLVIYGDLAENGELVRRPVYLRPFLVDTDNFPGAENERTVPERMLVDDLVRAVRRLRVGDEVGDAQAPSVVAVNLSFGIPDLVFDGSMSPVARCLDWLAWEYGVLFVVSAGNATDPLVVSTVADDVTFVEAPVGVRTEAVLAGLRDVQNAQRLLSPAEAMNALTIGAMHADAIAAAPNVGQSYDPFPEGKLPCVVSRMGLGYRGSAKPDLVAPGGRLRVHLRRAEWPVSLNRGIRPSRLGGLRVAGDGDPALGPQLSWSGATSGAAALTTHAIHKIHEALEDAYGEGFTGLPDAHRALVLKALVVHGSKRPNGGLELVERVFGRGEERHHSKKKADVARLFGFGELDLDSSAACAYSRATAWSVGEVRADRGVVFALPLPQGLIGQAVPKSITATVCWFSPIAPGRQGYRAVRLVIDEREQGFGQLIASLGTRAGSNQLDPNGTGKGTVFHRKWEGNRAANFQVGNRLEMKVSRMPDNYTDLPEVVPFALAVTIETEAAIPIYEEVLASLAVGLRPRLPQPVAVRPPQ